MSITTTLGTIICIILGSALGLTTVSIVLIGATTTIISLTTIIGTAITTIGIIGATDIMTHGIMLGITVMILIGIIRHITARIMHLITDRNMPCTAVRTMFGAIPAT